MVETAAYFVAAEALTNAAKHAGGAPARVRAVEEGDTLVVEVADAGKGGADRDGSGLTGLRHRVEALDGRLTITSPPGKGTDRACGAAVRVVIAEDLALLREGIVALLREAGIDVVAQAEDADGLLRIVARAQAGSGDRRRAAAAELHRRGIAGGAGGAPPPTRARRS